jgi:hypothetical protein
MYYQIETNPRHEHDKRTAFLQQLRAWDHKGVVIIVGVDDMIDPKGLIELGNFAIEPYYLTLVDRVVYVRDAESGQQLYPVDRVG